MNWEPWTGCYKISEGCTNCYFYGPHAKRFGQNTVQKTDKFDWPVRKNAKGEYNIKGNKILATCFATDFFLPEADQWRKEIWAMIKERTDIDFLILTKNIGSFSKKQLDAYRKDKIGFVFQSCNLIPHLSILENVTIALTLSNVGKEERTLRAKHTLRKWQPTQVV